MGLHLMCSLCGSHTAGRMGGATICERVLGLEIEKERDREGGREESE